MPASTVAVLAAFNARLLTIALHCSPATLENPRRAVYGSDAVTYFVRQCRCRCNKSTQVVIMAQNPSMAPSADEVHVHEHCQVLPGLPIVLDTPGLVEEVPQRGARPRGRPRRGSRQWGSRDGGAQRRTLPSRRRVDRAAAAAQSPASGAGARSATRATSAQGSSGWQVSALMSHV